MNNTTPTWPGWETVRLIGRGSFGAVYEIERDVYGHKEKAAMKVITIPQSESDIEELYDSGYDEASVTATFQSHLEKIVNEYSLMREMNGAANIVNCDDFRVVEHDDCIGWDIYIRMELLTPLAKAVDKQPSDETVIRIASDICKALILCKKHDIIHRDIKPQNIFVSKNGDYKLGDFGIAKTMEKTSGGTKIGTYKYMAPEVYNNQSYNHTADIYSLGLVLYWLLNERRTPFLPLPPETPKTTEEDDARTRRFKGEPIPAPAHGSEELQGTVLKACKYDPENRYQSAEEMLRDLEELKTSGVVLAPEKAHATAEHEPDEEINAPSQSSKKEHIGETTIGILGKTEEELISYTDEDKTEGGFTHLPIHEPKAGKKTIEKKKKLPIIIGSIALVFVLSALAYFVPGWAPATCETPETHRLLGLTRGEALGHKYTLATCTEPSVCEVCGEMSEGPIGHDWSAPTYTWSSDNSSVTAKRSCSICGETETETVKTTGVVLTAATCTENGKTTYTAIFENGAFSEQSKTIADIPAAGHKWGEVTYIWVPDNSSVTAKRSCSVCGESESETAKTTSGVLTDATCTENGKTTYLAIFEKDAFSEQSKTLADIPATGHRWGEPTYTWASDNSSVTAKRSCSVCGKSETETVKTTGVVSTAATCTEKGKTTYTAIFSNNAFSKQNKAVVDIPATVHDWMSATCYSPKTCRKCGSTTGTTLSHNWVAASATEPKHCTLCGATAPSVYDVRVFGKDIVYPKETSYLDQYETMYVKSKNGNAIFVYWNPKGDDQYKRGFTLPEKTEVVVLARENGFSCCTFTLSNGKRYIGWLASNLLVYEYY